MNQPAPLKTFIIYARSDEAYKQQLLLHLRPLLNSRLLSVWHDGNILPGEDWEKAIKKELSSSDLILVLVSANSLNSEFIQSEELRTALDRLREGLARVVPVIVSPCVWRFDPVLSGLQAMPLFGSQGPKPVNDRVWQNTDEAWSNVVENLGDMALELNEQRHKAARQTKEEQEAMERKAQHEKEAREAERISSEQKKAQEAETERRKQEAAVTLIERLRIEQEREKAHIATWTAASERHNITVYEQFLTDYPDSGYAREARNRIKKLRQAERQPRAWARWAGIGVGVLLLAFLVWKIFGSNSSDGVTSKHPVTNTGDSLQQKNPDPIPSQPDESAKTLSPETLPANTGVKKEEPFTKEDSPAKPFIFNYSMVRVEGGSFTMGSPATEKDRGADECQHTVSVTAFSIGTTEVTQAQWKSVMGSNPSNFKGDNLPVETVSWNEVQAFIKKLNEKTGKNFRLPKENEWEYAARGGNRSGGYIYAGSNNLDEVAWFGYAKAGKTTHPVGKKTANKLGLYDMSGNVWEWCQDKYGPYPGCSEPKSITGIRVVRGGSWTSDPNFCRTAYRFWYGSDDRSYGIGFRLAQ